MAKCPICYNDPGTYTDDPMLTPNHFMPTLRGNTILRTRHITEIQTQINLYETELGISLTIWTPTDAGQCPYRGQHINELREAIENILTNLGITLSDWLSWDENDEPTLDITGWLGGSRLAKGAVVRGMHIEELRKKLVEIWENFEKGADASISVIGFSTAVTDFFNLQKNQFWYANVYAGYEFYNHGLFWTSESSACGAITKEGSCTAVAYPKAYGGFALDGFHPSTSPFPAEATSYSSLSALISVVGGITEFPCSKQVWNSTTETYDTYHLFVKAQCSISVSCSGGYQSSGIKHSDNLWTQAERDAWNASPVIPNPYHNGKSEVLLTISTIFGGPTAGYAICWIHGAYHSYAPSSGIVSDLNNFNIDIAQAIIDNFYPNPELLYITNIEIKSSSYGIANSFDVKAGDAEEVPPGSTFWYKTINYTGGYVMANSSFTIDNINFYYKKVVI